MKKIAVFNPKDKTKIVVFRHLKNRKKFTYRTLLNGRVKDETEIVSKLQAEAMCNICGVEF